MSNRIKAILGLVGVFLVGGLCGALVVGIVQRDRARETQELRDRDGFVGYFTRRLELTEAQRDSLRDELEATYHQIAALRATVSDQYNQALDSLRKRIYPQLNPEQRTLFAGEEAKFRRLMPREAAPKMAAAPATRLPAATGPISQHPPDVASVHDSGHAPAQLRADRGATLQPAQPPPAAATARADTATAPATQPDNSATLAEPKNDPAEDLGVRSDAGVRKLLQELNLTGDQLQRLAAIREDFRDRVRELRKMPDKLTAVRLFRESNRDRKRKAFGVLDATQRQKVLDYLKARRDARKADAEGG